MLSSTRAFQRPPVNAVAQKEEDEIRDSDLTSRGQHPRPFGGGWARTRTAAPSDLTPEEKSLRNALQNESTRKPLNQDIPSLKNSKSQIWQGPHIKRYESHEYTRRPIIQSGPITPSPPPSTESRLQQRPRLGGWAKNAITTELTREEQALRQALQKEAAPKPHLPVHRISHSPHTSSVPGYPSMPDLQAMNDAQPEEITGGFSTQTSSIQRQGTQDDTINAGLPEHRQARDAQLDHHISQSRTKPLSQQVDWCCPSCAQKNNWTREKCRNCQTVRPSIQLLQCAECGKFNSSRYRFCSSCQTPIPPTTGQEPTEHAKHWKLVRRGGTDASPERSQLEQPPTQEHSRDFQAISRARAIEREKTERMERTKGGEFVGLRDQYESATSKAMKLSHWSFETDGSQVLDVEPSRISAPETSKTGNGLVTWRAQSATNSQINKVQGIRDKRSGQELAARISEDRPREVKLAGGWKRWEPPSEERQPPLEESPQRGTFEQAGESTQLTSFELERGKGARRLEFSTMEKERHTSRKPQEQDIARHSVYESTSMPYVKGNNRDRLRKSKKVVSTYDDVDQEDEDRAARRMERKEERKKARATQKAKAPPTPIYLPEFISISNLAGVLKVRVEDFIPKMKDLGFEETNNDHVLDAETAGLVAAEFNFEPIIEQAEHQDLFPRPPAENKSTLPPRPPVVTIMGHVDHGKTTLLDYLRKSSVAASEHGGITQHIGAFSVPMPGGRLVTFLDTPGHEAFLSMRKRGANVTDIVILVVAADDSVKPQTIEAIRHAQAARVPMIVAVNKIDKEDSNVERVKQDLARYGVEIEDYGGDTQVVCVSGKTGQGMEELEDATVALADILDMRSETDGQAEGWVLEATTKKAGRVATVLVKRGTLRPTDVIVAGTSWARVRSLRNEAGVMLKSAGPGIPVEIDGWREQPAAGDEVLQAPDEQRAKTVIEHRLATYERTQMATDIAAVNEARRLEQEKREELEKAAELAGTNPDAAASSAEGQSTPSTPSFQEVFFIIKADVSGSVEAVTDAVSALGNTEVRPHILRTGVGPITEFDIDHAAVAKGHIISFNTTVDGNIQRMAKTKDVKILDQSIIYRLVDDVKAKLSETLPEIVTQKVLGEAEIAQVFEINTKGRTTVLVAGCRVRNGVIGRNNKIRVLRGKEVIYDGTLSCVPCAIPFHADLIPGSLSSLKNVKKDVPEMRKGTECGMGFENWTEFKAGDQVQSYEETSEKRTL